MTAQPVGIVGVGNMGRPIAERLSEQGVPLLLWNRTADRAQGIAGATVAATPRDVAQGCDVILSILANDDAIAAIYHGDAGLLAADLTGRVVVEMATTSPGTVQSLAAAVNARGGLFLECPVSGNVVPARAGRLMGLAGGTEAAFDAARPVLDLLMRRLEHLGPVGTGAAMKLAVNLPLMVYWSALGEALALAMAQGVDPELALDILGDSSGAIGAAKSRIPPIAAMVRTGDPGTVSFTLTNAIKDMRLMTDLAQSTGQPHAVIAAVLAKAEAAAASGWADYDNALAGTFGLRAKGETA
ncbi:3-hydroxyisobutyrate dehydrogenase [Loktanella fryxellensis]|uniref:3-hydroxyisobutyrate dehydrogenase n=1 Tax=Loktanella fryxellensis TaxID=245187 RepID=A0A1H8C530_9RHOB|nr:NAD(P)-dependent oxidoreductase [Loktanella fryxellensis]SEM90160.1 3-hydroxyisobutyrate dehydrogenase [Loktanella fryxellensis]